MTQKSEKSRKTQQRYRLVSDNDGHWYLIKIKEEAEFDQWVAATCNDEETEFNFDDDRISGSPSMITFTDPKED